MNGGLDVRTMQDRLLIGSVHAGTNTLGVYILALRCDTSKKREVTKITKAELLRLFWD